MERQQFMKKNPLRILDKSIHSGLKPGNLAVIASPKGVGKTACLVYIATVSLMQGKSIIHVSFSSRTDHIVNWYEEIFKEIADTRNIEGGEETQNKISRNRVIMNFNQDGQAPAQVVRSLKSMILDGNFAADLVIVDGYNLSICKAECMKVLKDFAVEMGVCIWFSSSTKETGSGSPGVPEELLPFMDYVDVLVTLVGRKDFVALQLVKDYDTYPKEDLHVRLDPRTLLITEE